jgi:hypothetical protein
MRKEPEKYYATTKRCNIYIDDIMKVFKTKLDFEKEVVICIKDLEEFPEDNKNQIRFFSKVLDLSRAREK